MTKMNSMSDSTTFVSDIRNFTGTMNKFQKNEDRSFIDEFMIPFYVKHMELVPYISKNFYFNNNGDSMIFVFKGEYHYLDGYAFALAMYKILTNLCKEFNDKYNEDLSFGIGIDCGEVWDVDIKAGGLHLNVNLGSVINRAVRIESRTRDFHHTNMIVGGNIFKALTEKLNPRLYDDIKKFTTNYDNALSCDKTMNKFIEAGKDLMLFYNFESALKNIGMPLPLFKLLVPLMENKKKYQKLMARLTGNSYNVIQFVDNKFVNLGNHIVE